MYELSGTGSRRFRDTNVSERLGQFLMAQAKIHPTLRVTSGGAEGWDSCLAYWAIRLGLPLRMALPNEGYGDYYWRRHSVTGRDRSLQFQRYLDYAEEVIYVCDSIYVDGVHSNFIRNTWMVRHGEFFVVLDPHSPGTRDCFTKILKAHKPYQLFGEAAGNLEANP